jgi:ABC-type lipoprotein export system ATPase subunit
MAMMRDLRERYQTTFVFSTHDPRVVAHASRVVRLEDGRIRSVDFDVPRWVADGTLDGAPPRAVGSAEAAG